MTYKRFQDIPQFIRAGSWECDYDFHRVIPFLKEQEEKFGLDLNPDFQRGHVWTEKQQIAWLEFHLRGGITSRVIYLNKPSWHLSATTPYDDFVIVDGKQRVEAVRRFFENEIKVFDTHFKDYEGSPRMAQGMKVNINTLQTKKEVLEWYLHFNSGGTAHTKEEIEKVRKLIASPS